MEQLRKNPEQAMKDAGLSAAEQNILQKGDSDLIRITIAKELGIDSSLIKPFFTFVYTLTSTIVHVSVNVSVLE
jgi:hypothetical protein